MTTWLVVAAVAAAVVSAVRGTWSPCGLSMVSAINPMSEHARGNRYWLTCVWFAAGSVLGGMTLGAVAAVVAAGVRSVHLPEQLALGLAVAAAVLCLAADLRVPGIRLPVHPRQVNELWLDRYRRWIYAAGFGAQVGVGFATYIMTATTYLVVVLAALTGSPQAAFALGVLFGAVRGIAVLLSARVRAPADLMRLHSRLDELDPWSLRACEATAAVVSVGLAVAAWGTTGLLVALAATSTLLLSRGIRASSSALSPAA